MTTLFPIFAEHVKLAATGSGARIGDSLWFFDPDLQAWSPGRVVADDGRLYIENLVDSERSTRFSRTSEALFFGRTLPTIVPAMGFRNGMWQRHSIGMFKEITRKYGFVCYNNWKFKLNRKAADDLDFIDKSRFLAKWARPKSISVSVGDYIDVCFDMGREDGKGLCGWTWGEVEQSEKMIMVRIDDGEFGGTIEIKPGDHSKFAPFESHSFVDGKPKVFQHVEYRGQHYSIVDVEPDRRRVRLSDGRWVPTESVEEPSEKSKGGDVHEYLY